MPTLPLSVFIIAKNEADRIPTAIRSVRDWVDEVIVVDSGSEDDTVAASEALGARTLYRAWSGYGEQKVYGEAQCRNDWVLNIDADEEVSPALRAEIEAEFRRGIPTSVTAFTMPIILIYPFQQKGHLWTAYHRPVRLYRKSRAGFKPLPVHDSVAVRAGGTRALREMILHRSFRSLSHHTAKINFFTTEQARDLYARGRNPSALSLLLTPPLAFFKSLVLRRAFVYGIDGVIMSYMYAFQRFIRLAKAREAFLAERRSARGGGAPGR